MNSIQKSEAIKNGLRKGFQNGSSKMAKRKCYGYTINSDGELEINELLQGAVNHSLINVPYFLTQRLLYRIGDKLLSDFEEAAK